MKRWISLALSLLMLLTLAPTALAAETKPVPPAWVKAEEYAVFEGDSTYTGETWETVLRLRADAAAGNLEPQSGDLYTDWNIGEKTDAPASLQFELGLIGMKYAENSGSQRQARSLLIEFPKSLISFLRFSYTTFTISKLNTRSIICFLSAGDIVRNDLNFFMEILIILLKVA